MGWAFAHAHAGLRTAAAAAALALLAAAGEPACAADAADAVSVGGAADAAVPPAVAPAPADSGVLASARAGLRSGTEWIARGVDSWFGDLPFEEGGEVRDGRLSLSLLQRKGEPLETSVRFNARFRLPNVERRAYLFIGRDDPREVVTDKPGAFTRPEQLLPERADDRSLFAGVGVALRDALDFRLGFRGGLKPYAQLRWRDIRRPTAAERVELRQTVFWSVDDRLGATTALFYERALAPAWAARALAAGTVTQDTGTLEWNALAGVTRSFGTDRALSLEAPISGRLDRAGASDYGLQLRWEQPLHRDWVIGELVFGHFWPRPDREAERRRAWALGGQVKVRF